VNANGEPESEEQAVLDLQKQMKELRQEVADLKGGEVTDNPEEDTSSEPEASTRA